MGLVNDMYYPGDIAWVLASTCLVFLMIPGIGFFYSGMARSKHALSLIMLGVLAIPIVSIQWFLWGYSLTFSSTGGHFIGNLDNAFLKGVRGKPSPTSNTIPELVFSIFQLMFAAITPAIALGSAAERVRVIPALVFIFVWSTLVYDVIACWCWSKNGWSQDLGGLDFAGGTPVHISSGSAALAFSIALGSAEAASLRAVMACTVTNLAASVGGLVWMLMDYRLERKFSALGFCSGVVAGLVTITPASGFVSPPSSIAFGFCGGVFCNLAVKLKHRFDFDDALDVFAVHGVGGLVGNILTGIFADSDIASLDSTPIPGGAINGHPIQILKQLAASGAGMIYSFTITYAILFIMNRIPGLSLRLDPDDEEIGTDEAEIGESAYYFVERLTNNFPITSVQPKTLVVQTSQQIIQSSHDQSSHMS
ncbi:17592_t:CDS:2 [Acaulospora morrowiae]|uniref:17592_t:CDS:1 n=1 Tax=Acaulospora morrowiae TaxID=94023 RepID=A0A9N9AJJ7_9GLOM|nr:17592_t:CDS:2 [Acaulospora morrowiae]